MSTELEFTNKVVLITGSSGGLGAEMAKEFAKKGAQLVITGRNGERVTEVANECDVLSPAGLVALQVVADVTIDEDIERLVETTIEAFGQIDVLVNNAGAGPVAAITDPVFMDTFDHIFRLDVRSVVLLTQLAVPYLETTKGVIINISSICSLKPIQGISSYCMAKSAMDMFTKCMALELGPKGIRVNAVNPTVVRTGFQKNSGSGEMYDNILVGLEAKLGKIPEPVDIANAVLFLASNKSAFITGVCMLIDCGTMLI